MFNELRKEAAKLEVVKTTSVNAIWATPKDIKVLFKRKNPTSLLKDYREFADHNPSIFGGHKPYIKNAGMDTLYNVLALAFYIENKDLLEAGTRSIKFKDELNRLKEVYL